MAEVKERCTIYAPWHNVSDIIKVDECVHYNPNNEGCNFKGSDCPTTGRRPQ